MPQHRNLNSTETEVAFYTAFERCDLQAMTAVWDTSPEATCIHPGGQLLLGHAAVIQSWGEIFSQAKAPQVRYRVLQTLHNDGLAIHTVEEAISPSGSTTAEPTLLIATNVYRQTTTGWRMVSHHACLPMMRQRSASARAAHSVH